jgi:surface protein
MENPTIIGDISNCETIVQNNDEGAFIKTVTFKNMSDEPIEINFNANRVEQLKGCFKLHKIFYDKDLVYANLNETDTSKITDLSMMFCYCESLTSLDLSNFDTGNITNMSSMFHGCISLTSLDLSNFKTGKVTNMDYMFHYCENLQTLDLSSFDTSKVNDMSYMLTGCTNLRFLDLSNFNIKNATSVFSMLGDCHNLHTIRLDNCNYDTINKIITSYDFDTVGIATLPSTLDKNKIYINPNNIGDLKAPKNWIFVNCETNEVIN